MLPLGLKWNVIRWLEGQGFSLREAKKIWYENIRPEVLGKAMNFDDIIDMVEDAWDEMEREERGNARGH